MTPKTSAASTEVTRNYTCPDGTPFPVIFESEEQASFGWRWDQMHSPLPFTPLSIIFSTDTGDGFNIAVEALGGPMRFERVRANGYSFLGGQPFDGDLQARLTRNQEQMTARAEIIQELWETRYRPEVEALTSMLLAFDDPALSLRNLADQLDQVHAVKRRLGELHHLVMMPAQFAGNRFVDFCVEELGDQGERMSGELTQGMPNKSLESAIALWQLSREAKARPDVAEALRYPRDGSVLGSLKDVSGGKDFLAIMRAFLAEYGWRNESFTELSPPSWREDPSFPLFTLRQYIDAADDAGPAAMHGRTVARREAATAEIEGRLADNASKLDTFFRYQKAALQRTVLLEDHNFYIDQKSQMATRVPCLAIGRRLAEQGTIDSQDDVFYLFEADIQQAAVDSSQRYQSLVAERRADRERWMHTLPPATIGDGASEMPVQMQRFFGPTASEPQQDGIVKGIAASAGVVRGTARIVRTLDEVERLSPGEILVTYATAPPWTPLFAIASAVVTDAGGMLSHCAVVAREYGIPAVTGSKTATARIPDGALITVDGAAGTVRDRILRGPGFSLTSMQGPAIQDLIPHNHCWGCGPDNHQGLQLKSYVDGDDVVATWQPGPPFFAGPRHVLNGGIIAALIDCHSVCTAIADLYLSEGRAIGEPPDLWCATASLSISYRRPVSLDRQLDLRARVTGRDEKRSTVECSLSSGGKECACGEAVAVRVPESWREA